MKIISKQAKCVKGFALNEVILIVFIIFALSVIALPRVYSVVEISRGSEAFGTLGNIRRAMDRCKIVNNGSYDNCLNFDELDISNPGSIFGSHFLYIISKVEDVYTITANRNSLDGGDSSSQIMLILTPAGIAKAGSGIFSEIN